MGFLKKSLQKSISHISQYLRIENFWNHESNAKTLKKFVHLEITFPPLFCFAKNIDKNYTSTPLYFAET